MGRKQTGLAYRPDIDGLRAVAVIAVVLHHIWPKVIPGGFIGVDVFFVISGYLITKIVAGEIRDGSFTFASFYLRRARRLLPALLVVLISVIVAGWFFLLPSDYVATLRASFATTIFSSNILFWRDLSKGYFAADAKLNPLLHTWSLGVEEQFYLVFPIFLMLCARVFPARTKLLVLVGIPLSLGMSIVLIHDRSVAVFFLAPFRAWELLAGSAIALNAVPPLRNEVARRCVVGVGLLVICAATFAFSSTTTFPGLAALIPVLGSAAVIHAGGQGLKPGPQSFVSTRPFVYVGRISYSWYLWHWPLVVFVKYVSHIEIGLAIGLLLVLLSFGMAVLSHRFVESPFRSGGGKGEKAFLGFSIGSSIAVAGISLAGVALGGVESRVSQQMRTFDRARHPEIPFQFCDRRADWCVVGSKAVQPTTIFWGDSHMLAWAPAIDQVLRASGRSAFLVVHSACPPVWELEIVGVPTCATASLGVKRYLSGHTGIRMIVLAANWRMYLKPDRIRAFDQSANYTDQTRLFEAAINRTVEGLTRDGAAVTIIGSVPTYGGDVPFELARNAGRSSAAMELKPSADSFGPALSTIAEKWSARYVDVASVMCQPNCELQTGGQSTYRDGGHLSVAGALAHASLIREAIGESPRSRPGQQGTKQ